MANPKPKVKIYKCEACGGSGAAKTYVYDIDEVTEYGTACNACHGTGWVMVTRGCYRFIHDSRELQEKDDDGKE